MITTFRLSGIDLCQQIKFFNFGKLKRENGSQKIKYRLKIHSLEEKNVKSRTGCYCSEHL